MFQRNMVSEIRERMREAGNPLLQVIVGPRQTGKSTMLTQALEEINLPYLFVSSDDAEIPSRQWLETQWQQARHLATSNTDSGAKTSSKKTPPSALLVVDEIQKVPKWSSAVKALWDEDQVTGVNLKVFLSGSSSLLIQSGLEESLMGRFELLRSTHWSFAECREAFGFDLDDFLFFGGFPGAARFVKDEARWRDYLRNSIIEPTIAMDAFAVAEIRKPALLRALFSLGARFSGQELSYTKMLGQLHDAGNTTTLASYLDTLGKVGMLAGLSKYHPSVLTSRKSSPRLMVFDTALMTATSTASKKAFLADSEARGHLVESAVGASLLARGPVEGFEIFWWREGNAEVDFVLRRDEDLVALEVKSGRQKPRGGMDAFLRLYPEAHRLVVGGGGRGAVDLEAFLAGQVPLFD